jgi:hypothetical protein
MGRPTVERDVVSTAAGRSAQPFALSRRLFDFAA